MSPSDQVTVSGRTAGGGRRAAGVSDSGNRLDAGTPAGWVAGDEVYGNDPKLRAELARRGVGYVLAVACDHRVTTGIGVRKAVELAVRLPAPSWQRLSAGASSKGERYYDWALLDTEDKDLPGRHWLLVRRPRPALVELATPSPSPRQGVPLPTTGPRTQLITELRLPY